MTRFLGAMGVQCHSVDSRERPYKSPIEHLRYVLSAEGACLQRT